MRMGSKGALIGVAPSTCIRVNRAICDKLLLECQWQYLVGSSVSAGTCTSATWPCQPTAPGHRFSVGNFWVS